MSPLDVYLVPGFLGFDVVGEAPYFVDVPAALAASPPLADRELAVHPVGIEPAGSLARRAACVAEQVARTHRPGATVHFVGHSTGGLDVRLLLSPGSGVERRLAHDLRPACEAAVAATRSAISLATPHLGTPAADVFQRAGGDVLLRALGYLAQAPVTGEILLAVIRTVGPALAAIARVSPHDAFLQWMVASFLGGDPRSVVSYLGRLRADQGATMHLGVAVADTLDALLVDRPGVRYRSFCTAPPAPAPIAPVLHAEPGQDDPIIVLNSQLYRVLWLVVGAGDARFPLPEASGDALRACVDSLSAADRAAIGPVDLSREANDGIVPTWSQVHGEVGGVVASDHLDCVGMYPHRDGADRWVSGWVRSGAEFRDDRFRWLWGRIAAAIAADAA